MHILLRNLSVIPGEEPELRDHACRALALRPEELRSLRVLRRSVDARRNTVRLSFHVEARTTLTLDAWRARGAPGQAVEPFAPARPLETAQRGGEPLAERPVVVGLGPAGLLAAYALARLGYEPLVLERGGEAGERERDIRSFFSGRRLDGESNLLFGAGGAGFFSDGKLYTGRASDLGFAVLQLLVDHGAPDRILVEARPHIGTDGARKVSAALVEAIRALGGTVRFHTRLEGLARGPGPALRLSTSAGEVTAGAVVLGLGGSARDTFPLLARAGLVLSQKPFQMGLRVEHPQEFIDHTQYGRFRGHPSLPPAEYRLKARVDGSAVFTFCMCPGGLVVPVASEADGVASNGASPASRSMRRANGAVMVSVSTGNDGFDDGVAYQRRWESLGFRAGGGDFTLPAQPAADFLAGRDDPRSLASSCPTGVRYAPLWTVAPPRVVRAVRAGLRAFDRRMPGFSGPEALVLGPETRGSSPVRMDRDGRSREAVGWPGVYPVGEGAGYAGGILSAAVDGLASALALARKWAPAE